MKKVIALAVAGVMVASSQAVTLNEGTKELTIGGMVRRDQVAGELKLGYFVMHGLELGLGVNGSYYDYGNDADFRSYGAGLFAQYNFDLGGTLVPFVGVEGGWQYAKVKMGSESSDENGVEGAVQLGVKQFIADNIAVSLYGYYARSNKEVYSDKDEMKKDDLGLRIGMNSYF